MSKNKDEHIKDLININSIDKAPVNFTSKVMQDVFMTSNEEALKSKELNSLLKRTAIEKPSYDFVTNIMDQVAIQKEIQYKPLISKKAWFIISVTIVVLLLSVFLTDAPKESSSLLNKVSPYLDQAHQVFTNPFKNIAFSPLLTMSLLCLSSMLFFDTLLKRRLFN
jgi:hypothetical protein